MKVWHKVPTSDKLGRMKWLHAMRRAISSPTKQTMFKVKTHSEAAIEGSSAKMVFLKSRQNPSEIALK